ncbi:hypothetical protein [Pseudomonas sp. TCU-HL1]|nr:hypothetical protein [Pseudomonas sp. TCU-HL1]
MSDDNTKVQKKTETVDALPVSSKGQQFSAAVYLLFVTCLADAQ